MVLLVTTKSGSVYRLDLENKKFSRVNTDPKANILVGSAEMEGDLVAEPRVAVGAPLFIDVVITKPELGLQRTTWIRSTAVVSIVDESYLADVVEVA
jgi:hypothetical protein